MKLFYTLLLWLAEFDLAIARSTGRNPDHIRALQADVDRWQHALLMLELNT
jgi:hypothetical protein